MLRRLSIIMMTIIMLMSAGPACISNPAPKNVEISFYKRGYVPGGKDVTSETIAKAVEVFRANHPNITVHIVGVPWTTEGTNQLEAALVSHSGMHVFSVSAIDLARYARAGYLSELDPYLTANDRSDFYTSGLQAAAVDGKIYAWPVWVTAVSIFANTAIFEERGVALPTLSKFWTWEEFVTAGQHLTFSRADGSKVYAFNASSQPGVVVYQPLIYMDGGRVLSPDGRKFTQNSAEGLSALQKMADMTQVYKITPPDFGNVDQLMARKQFTDGQLAMVMDTPSFLSELEKSGNAIRYAVIPPPAGKLGRLVTGGAFGLYGVVKVTDSQEQLAAHEFARYITGSQVAKDVPGYQQAPGLRKSNTSFATNANREIIAKLVAFGVYEPPVSVSPEARLKQETAMQSVILGLKKPPEAMAEIAPIFQRELDMQFAKR